jgi:hypothetical protein
LQAFIEPENRVGLLATSLVMKIIHRKFLDSGASSVCVADEDVSAFWFGFVMKTHLKEIISLKASQLQEAGILTRELKFEFMEDNKSKPEKIGPQVLTLQNLSAGFVVISCLLALSVAVFAVEVAPKLLKNLRAWLEKAVFCYVVMKFTKLNKLI